MAQPIGGNAVYLSSELIRWRLITQLLLNGVETISRMSMISQSIKLLGLWES
ncbi:hypothetical protein JCM10914_832 [Paenibacillus sp. JCM 10914]|nr:hypothetical protein JCM10914_832 [Paenibacillus sp. JCM 10914]